MLGDMLTLEDQFHEVHLQCIPEHFAAQLTKKPFSGTKSDEVIEMTLNRDSKHHVEQLDSP